VPALPAGRARVVGVRVVGALGGPVRDGVPWPPRAAGPAPEDVLAERELAVGEGVAQRAVPAALRRPPARVRRQARGPRQRRLQRRQPHQVVVVEELQRVRPRFAARAQRRRGGVRRRVARVRRRQVGVGVQRQAARGGRGRQAEEGAAEEQGRHQWLLLHGGDARVLGRSARCVVAVGFKTARVANGGCRDQSLACPCHRE